MIVIYVLGALFLIVACYLWVKFVFAMCNILNNYFNRNKIKEDNNPYISEQKDRMKNTENYEDYLKWMRTKGDGMIIEKVIARDEFEANEKIKKYLND
jgi:hypothetical protein